MKINKGDYLRNKELGIIDIVEFDCIETGKQKIAGEFYQLKVVRLPYPFAHGSYIGNVCWKSVRELEKGYEIIKYNENNNTMKITNLVKKLLDSDTRTLVKAGFINGDLALTDDGISELIGILFLEKKAELVKIAQANLDEANSK